MLNQPEIFRRLGVITGRGRDAKSGAVIIACLIAAVVLDGDAEYKLRRAALCQGIANEGKRIQIAGVTTDEIV